MPLPALPLLRFGIESGIELFEDLICSGDQQEIKLAALPSSLASRTPSSAMSECSALQTVE